MDMLSIGAAVQLVKGIPGSAAGRAETAAERAETAAELAEARAYYDPLLIDEIPGTVQAITRDASGNVVGMTHTKNGEAFRTDTYQKTATTMVETRMLASGRGITITTNLETKQTTITEVE